MIKDSGERREFSTGAVRDMAVGKGRCDLMPLNIVAALMNDEIICSIASFQQTGLVIHLYTALGAFSKFYEKGLPDMMLEVSKHYEEGCIKYGENNWQKGLPISCYIDSMVRHYLKFIRGDDDEEHGRAFVWSNVLCVGTKQKNTNV